MFSGGDVGCIIMGAGGEMIKTVIWDAKFGDNTAFVVLMIASDRFFCGELEEEGDEPFKMFMIKSTEFPCGEMENIEV